MNPAYKKNLLLFSLASETFLSTYGLLFGNQTAIVSLLYPLAGLIFIYSLLLLPAIHFSNLSMSKKEYGLKIPLFLIMVILAWVTSSFWLEKIPLDPDYADMLPIIKVMNERLLHGQWRHIYDPVAEIWQGITPIYLPAMWLPYLSAVALDIDIRWVTVIAVLSSFSIVLFFVRFKRNGYFGSVLLAITALLFWWLFARNDIHGLISLSEEGIVIFYFVLLTLSIISNNAFFIGLTASLCMLSRYSMIGWFIPCLIFFTIGKEGRKALIISATGGCFFLFFFLLPFGTNVLYRMIALPGNYIDFAKHVWESTPEVFWLNLGMAKFFGPAGTRTLHHTLLLLSFILPLLFMSLCLTQKKVKLQNINLACFKFSLLVFYQFIDVPYGYLFYPSSFVSLIIAANLLTSSERI